MIYSSSCVDSVATGVDVLFRKDEMTFASLDIEGSICSIESIVIERLVTL